MARAGEGLEAFENRNPRNAAGDRVSVSDLILLLSESGKQTATTSGGGRAALEADNGPNTHLIDSEQGERGRRGWVDDDVLLAFNAYKMSNKLTSLHCLLCECVLCKWPERKIVFKWISMQRSVKHFTPRKAQTGWAGGTEAGAAQKDMRRLQPLERQSRDICLCLDAIKHFINESFQLLARDFTLSHVPRQQERTIAGLNIHRS